MRDGAEAAQMAVFRMRERARKFGLNQMSSKDVENEIRAVRRARQRQSLKCAAVSGNFTETEKQPSQDGVYKPTWKRKEESRNA